MTVWIKDGNKIVVVVNVLGAQNAHHGVKVTTEDGTQCIDGTIESVFVKD